MKKIIIFFTALLAVNIYTQVGMQWISTYNSSAGSANNVVVDASGNIYVTGRITNPGTASDILTTKYSPTGAVIWQQIYNSPFSKSDEGMYIKLDQSGNVFVAGDSYDAQNVTDIVLLKYNNAGVFQWVTRYNGGGFGGGPDNVIGIAFDAGGNIFLCGNSNSSGTSMDIVIIKYTTAGTSSWIVRYDNSEEYASGMVLDNNSNIYICGKTRISYDLPYGFACATIKYDSAGVFQWLRTYKSPTTSEENLKSISIDNTGNIIVGGTARPNLNSDDYIIIKYNPAGVQQWLKFFDSPNYDLCYGMFLDNANNIILTGNTFNLPIQIDILTVKYNSNGDLIWSRIYDNPAHTEDRAAAICRDAQNNYYIAGTSSLSSNLNDLLLFKYDSSGNFLWKRTYNGIGNFNDGYKTITTDNFQNIIGVGFIIDTPSIGRYTTLKYTQTAFHDIAMGPFTGIIPQYNTNTTYGIKSVIYNNGTGSESNIPVKWFVNDVLINSSVVANLTSGQYDTVTASWMPTAAGLYELKYVSSFTGDSNRYNDTIKIIVSVVPLTVTTTTQYVCRRGLNKFIGSLFYVYDTIMINDPNAYQVVDVNITADSIIYGTDGELVLSVVHQGYADTLSTNRGGFGDNFINTVFNDSAQFHISQGTAPFSGSYRPEVPLLNLNGYNPNGAWIFRIIANSGGDTGYLRSWCLQVTYTTGIGVNSNNSNIPERFALYQNYPNPFNPTTKIKFDISPSPLERAGVRLVVYDALGREVQTLVNEPLQPGTYEVDWDGSSFSSGVYYYTIFSGDYLETKKMVIIK